MSPGAQTRNLVACLLALAGAVAAILLSGSADEVANVAAVAGAGLCIALAKVQLRIAWIPAVLGFLFCTAAALPFLPADLVGPSPWRSALPEEVMRLLGRSVCPQPWLAHFWYALLAGTTVFGVCLLSIALDGRRLAYFLHAVAASAAVYAVLSVVDFQTDWSYPYSGNAPFGFLPNKNHTATLLFVGAIVSFGLMQWEIARGWKTAAVLAAFCGAPPLAALLFFSNSRAGVVFLGVGLLIWAAGAGRSGSRKVILAGVAILVAFLFVLFLAGGSEVRNRLSVLLSEAVSVRGEGVDAPKDLDFRLPIFRDTFKLVADQPWTGVGLGQFKYVFPHYRDESSRAAVILHPESDWLMVAAESGLPATGLLLLLVGWYAAVSWRGRHDEDGLLRWTAASAVLAAILHGVVDVPWHRVSLGWFLFVIAAVCVPRNAASLKHPWTMRTITIFLGFAFLGSAYFMARELAAGRPPLPYRWKAYNAAFTKWGSEMAWEEGEAKIGEAISTYPLEKDAYYWALAFTEVTGAEFDAIVRSGRAVEPVLPQVAEGQARLWQGIDASREAEAWGEAARRSLRTDALEPKGGSASTGALIDRAVQSLAQNPAAQIDFLGHLPDDPALQARWFRGASPEAAETWAGRLPDSTAWLDGLTPDLREQVLARWISLPSAGGAVDYMEARNAPAPGAYWRQLAEHYAKAGDMARAVGMVAEAEGVPLDSPLTRGEFGGQLAGLEGQGNIVSVRRLLKEATEVEKADPDKLRVAVTWYAAAEDWEMAWKAASRLVTATKNRQ